MLPVCYDPYAGTLGKFTRSEIFELVSKGGYEGINIPVNNAFLGDLSQGEIDDMKKLVDKYNLTVPTVGFGNHILTAPDLKSGAFEHFEIVLDVAQQIDADIIGIWPNPTQNASREESLETLAENLYKICPILAENNLIITIEFEKGCPIDNYRDGITFIQDTQLPIRLTCDTYHLFNDNADPYKSVLEMGDFIGDAHISGSHRGEPGTGEFDFDSFAFGLKEIGFNGPLVIQYKMEDVGSISRSCMFTQKLKEQIITS
ncbi:MAG: sugar phosphate isomerase/epimerase family protein [Candidatus Poribacteria bacterium]|nr:sugar phosphate isomerase/epimerase [Candidatus Poribacteria bacterium]MEC7866276.1 sugar phosphate isomerase/epimerase family protein [Candidatus Poribacteria bacterium]